MSEMKYLVVDSGQGEQLFTFPKNIDHDEFAAVLSYINVGSPHNWKRVFRNPVSAGFTDGTNCYGMSETLMMKSRVEDTELLQRGGMK
jgi:thioredoxin-related protein